MPAAADLAGRLAQGRPAGVASAGGGSAGVSAPGATRGAAAAGAAAPSPRGAFIVLEGVDRCGKSTQCARLVEALQAEGVSFVMEGGEKKNPMRWPSQDAAPF
jgi:dTMP kinase